jgi:hypothetical protein
MTVLYSSQGDHANLSNLILNILINALKKIVKNSLFLCCFHFQHVELLRASLFRSNTTVTSQKVPWKHCKHRGPGLNLAEPLKKGLITVEKKKS